MPKSTIAADLEIKNLNAQHVPHDLIDGQVPLMGYEEKNQLYILSCIEKELALPQAQKPHVAWQLIHALFEALSTDFPNIVHFMIAREALKDEDIKNVDRRSKEYKDCVILVATRLNEHCSRIKTVLSQNNPLNELSNELKSLTDKHIGNKGALSIIDYSDTYPAIDSLYEKKDILLIDDSYLKYLKTIGVNGRLIAKNLRSECKKAHAALKKTPEKYPFELWFNSQPSTTNPYFMSHALLDIARAIWCDDVSRKKKIITSGVPAITTIVKKSLMEITSPSIITRKDDQKIKLINNTHVIGSVQLPLVNPDIVKHVLNGIHEFKSLTAARLIFFYVERTFNQRVSGINDYRVLRFDGSDKEIATLMGLTSNRDQTRIRDINHALNHFEFIGPEIKSRLINLAIYKSPKTGRLEGKEISVQSPLLPYRCFEDRGFLIPVIQKIPFVDGKDHWVSQFLLHITILEEFVKQAMTLAEVGGVAITDNKWKEFSDSHEISKPILSKIKERWIRDGEDGAQFLKNLGGNTYTLGSTHKKCLDFIINGGKGRLRRRKGGQITQEKRWKNNNN